MDLPDRHQTNDLPAEVPPHDPFYHSIPHQPYNHALQNSWVSFDIGTYHMGPHSSICYRTHPLPAMVNMKAIVKIYLRQSGVLLRLDQVERKIRTASTWPIKVL